MRRIAHIVNPVIVNKSSDLFVAQPVTFETMKRAKEFSCELVDVTFVSAQYTEDRAALPGGFRITPDLERSVLDVKSFTKKRKLPLLKDILDRLYEAAPEAEYLIYTNVDIALMPHFYLAVNDIIELGYDSFVINRRTISGRYRNVAELSFMYAEIGEPHIGHDCFIFRRDAYSDFKLGDACIGGGRVDKVLLLNLICNSNKFEEFTDLHLTFHIGDARIAAINTPEQLEYRFHNHTELKKVFKYYKNQKKLPDHPWIEKIVYRIELLDKSDKQENWIEGIKRKGAIVKLRKWLRL